MSKRHRFGMAVVSILWPVASLAAPPPAAHAGTTAAPGAAAPGELDQPLQEWERDAIDLARPSDAYATLWLRQAVQAEQASEHLRRAALLSRCPSIARHDAPFLDAGVRDGIEEVAERQRGILARHDGPRLQRWQHRRALAAYRALAPEEQQALRALMATAEGQRARSWYAALTVLESFPDHARVGDGRTEPARIVWLKSYLQAEPVWPAVMQALQGLDATLAQGFEAVRPLEQYRPEDAAILREQAQAVSALLPRVVQTLVQAMPRAELQALERLASFQESASVGAADTGRRSVLTALRAPGRQPDPPPAPGRDPEPESMPQGLRADLLRLQPVELAGDIARRLCGQERR